MYYNLNVEHVDTCLPCYVLDHCNREGECLVGVPIDGSTTYAQARESLIEEATIYEAYLPEDMPDQVIIDAINEHFKSAEPKAVIDPNIGPHIEGEDCVCLWFRFSWESAR